MLLVFSVLLVVSCSSSPEPTETGVVLPTIGSDNDPTPTVVPDNPIETAVGGGDDVRATATATVGIVPTSTPPPTATPVVELAELEVGDVMIGNCRISGELQLRGFSGSGTAPGPTPTPLAPRFERKPETVKQEALVFSQYLYPIIESLSSYEVAFEYGWRYASSERAQAAQLYVYGNRIAQLCSAISQPSIPREFFNASIGLGEAIRAKHAWALEALAELECCGDARTPRIDVGREVTSSAISDSIGAVDGLFILYINAGSDLDNRHVVSERFGLIMELSETDILVRNTIDLLVIGSNRFELLDPISLGPSLWTDGTGVRIRRVRNRVKMSLDEAVIEHQGTIGRYGELIGSGRATISGVDSLHFDYDLSSTPWKGAAVVYVLGDFTYVVESMCQPVVPDQCESISALIESLTIR